MKRKTKRRIQKTMITLMLTAVSLPLFSGFMPQENNQGLVTNPELMKALVEAQQEESEAENLPVLPDIEGDYKIVDIVDGTTISIMYGDEKKNVKLIGLTVPEESKEQAAALLKEELSLVDMVSLEFDEQDKDEEENLLAYAYLPDDHYTTINSKLLLAGYAKLSKETINTRYIEDLRSAEKQAREKKIGLWAEEARDDR